MRYALREAVEQMDFDVIHQLVLKARTTMERIAAEQLAANTPEARERLGGIVIHDDAEGGKIVIHFAEPLEQRERRWLNLRFLWARCRRDVLVETHVPPGREDRARSGASLRRAHRRKARQARCKRAGCV